MNEQKNNKGVGLYQEFPITSVCLADLQEHYDIENIDASTMENLASKMANAYCENGFWIDLLILADALKINKK